MTDWGAPMERQERTRLNDLWGATGIALQHAMETTA